MKALILAGGFGTRLLPLTATRPKHLLPIANRAHIAHVFDLLGRHGIDEIVLLTSYLSSAFTPAVDEARSGGLRVEVVHEREPLDSAGALKNAEAIVRGETFLALNGDILTDVDLRRLIEFHRSRRALATISLAPVADPSVFGVVPARPDGRVQGFIEKPPPGEAPTNLVNAGIYVCEPELLDHVPPGRRFSLERDVFPGLVDAGAPLYAVRTDAYWVDVGTPAKYLEANRDALSGVYRTDAVAAPGPAVSLVARGADVARDANVSASCIGTGAEVHEGASVERSVMLPGAVVEKGARVAESILGEGARVEAGARAVGVTVGDGDSFDNA
jgi:mannose-1-phosphate guanylyltransferase